MKRNLLYHSRISADFDVCIETAQGDLIHTCFESVSRSGLEIHCDRLTLERVLPNIPSISPKRPADLNVAINLPSDYSKSEAIHVSCHVTYVRRVSRDEYKLCMDFADINPVDYQCIDRYIEDQWQHQDNKISA